MILQALNSYYERLAADPDQDVAPIGFSVQKIAFCVVINPDGTLNQIEDLRTSERKKLIPKSMQLLGGSKPSGSGLNPCFLWDNPAYMLGFKPEDPKPARTREAFEAFRQKHLDLEAVINDPAFAAVCQFLKQWDPSQAEAQPVLVEIATGFGVFRMTGESRFVHEIPSVHRWWLAQLEGADDSNEGASEQVIGQCLVSGRTGPIARLHDPKIKGVAGAQSAGASIVSFNLEAFESYGKSQSNNAPVSVQAAFQYCTALNKLLTDRTRRVQIGDATVVFWTEQSSAAEDAFGFAMGNSPEDENLVKRLEKILETIAQGRYPSEFGAQETPFYVLGLSPNAARISVRFWYVSTLGEMVVHLRQHYEDLRIVKQEKDPDWIAPWQILRETARESKEISPILSGALARSILTGQPYPNLLLGSVIRRIRADRSVRYLRAAVIKACLNRDTRFKLQPLTKEIGMSLDPDREDPPYRLGRLFAQLEKAQEDAQPGINSTITDRFFSAASATPGSVFPRLIRSSKHHLAKLEERSRRYHERRIQQIFESLIDFPAHMNLKDQGLFAIGYYHQRQDIFTKKTTTAETGDTEE